MNGKSCLILAAFLVAVAGCGDDQQPIPAVCFIEPAFVDFGQVLAPVGALEKETINRSFSITNQVQINSTHGNANLAGALTLHQPKGTGHAPEFKLVPAPEDSTFLLTPRQTIVYNLAATVDSETEAGRYSGYISLGPDCGDLPFVLRVFVRNEPPPNLAYYWGRTGDEAGRFDYPTSIAVDDQGDVYVLEDNHDRVQVFNAGGELRAAWSVLRDQDGFPVGATDFTRPSDIEVGPDGNLHLTDVGRNRAFVFDRSGHVIKTWGAYLKPPSSAFLRPYSIAVDADGYVHVLDTSLHKVLKFDVSQTNPQVLLAEWGSDGTAAGQFGTISDIEIDHQGNIYLSDWENNAVHKFSAEGTFITRWGVPGDFIGEFDRPLGMGIDADDNIYVADSRNGRIQKFDSDGNFLTTWGTRGGGVSQFGTASDVAIGPDGRIYISDATNDRILVYQYP